MNKRIKKKRHVKVKLYKKIIGKKLKGIPMYNMYNLRDNEYYMTLALHNYYSPTYSFISVPINHHQKIDILRYKGKKYLSYVSFNDEAGTIDIIESKQSMHILISEYACLQPVYIRCTIVKSPFNGCYSIANYALKNVTGKNIIIPLMIDINHIDLSLLTNYKSFKEYLLQYAVGENVHE